MPPPMGSSCQPSASPPWATDDSGPPVCHRSLMRTPWGPGDCNTTAGAAVELGVGATLVRRCPSPAGGAQSELTPSRTTDSTAFGAGSTEEPMDPVDPTDRRRQ